MPYAIWSLRCSYCSPCCATRALAVQPDLRAPPIVPTKAADRVQTPSMAVAARNELGVMVTSHKDAISTCAIDLLQCRHRFAGGRALPAGLNRQAKLAPDVSLTDNATLLYMKPSLHEGDRRSGDLDTEIGRYCCCIAVRSRILHFASDASLVHQMHRTSHIDLSGISHVALALDNIGTTRYGEKDISCLKFSEVTLLLCGQRRRGEKVTVQTCAATVTLCRAAVRGLRVSCFRLASSEAAVDVKSTTNSLVTSGGMEFRISMFRRHPAISVKPRG